MAAHNCGTKASDEPQAPATSHPPALSSKLPPDFTLHHHLTDGAIFHRRRTGNMVASAAETEPHTPLLRWRFEETCFSGDPAAGRRVLRPVKNEVVAFISARKLGAALWQFAANVTATSINSRKPGSAQLRITLPIYQCSSDYGTETKSWLQEPHSNYDLKCKSLSKGKSSFPFPTFAMEAAFKWDPEFSKSSTAINHVFIQRKLLTNGPLETVSALSQLQADLVHTRAHIRKLEIEQQSFKKKVKHFLKKHDEEQTAWLTREHKKVRATLSNLKHELDKERIHCQKMNSTNSKLRRDLADANLLAEKSMQDYEKERKSRKLMEEVCHGLSKNIEDVKTEVEALKRRSERIHKEVEEERMTLQMAEVWREERVQVKMVNTRLVLEEKYQQMSKVISDLETFLKVRGVTQDRTEMCKAEVNTQTFNSADSQVMTKFSKSNDKYSSTGDFHEAKEKDTAKHESEFNTKTSEYKCGLRQKYSDGFVNDTSNLESTGDLESSIHADNQGSCHSPNRSDYSVNRISEGVHISRNDAKNEQHAGEESFNSVITEISKSAKRLNLLGIYQMDDDIQQTSPVERKEELKNQSTSEMSNISSSKGTVEIGVANDDVMGQCISPDLGNPHITRGVKGFIKWSRGIQRHGSKAKRNKGKKLLQTPVASMYST